MLIRHGAARRQPEMAGTRPVPTKGAPPVSAVRGAAQTPQAARLPEPGRHAEGDAPESVHLAGQKQTCSPTCTAGGFP